MRINCHLIISSFLETLERVMNCLEKDIEVRKTSKGVQFKRDVQPKLSLSPARARATGAVYAETETQVTYGLCIQRSKQAPSRIP